MQLLAQKREKLGKQNKPLRQEGLIPAVLYGKGLENQNLAVNAKEFSRVFKEAGANTLIDLVVGDSTRKALIHDVQRNFLSDGVDHVDFYAVRMDEKTSVHVPIEFVGESPAVKELGGILNRSMSEVEVEALPADLPHKFTLDISRLTELDQSLYVKDLNVPAGVEVMASPDGVIATVTEPREEEVAPPVAADVSEVKVEGEEKKAEREKEAETQASET